MDMSAVQHNAKRVMFTVFDTNFGNTGALLTECL